MSDLRSETLIRRLAQEAAPVRPILRPVVAGAVVVTAWAAVGATALMRSASSGQLASRMGNGLFVAVLAGLLVGAAGSVLAVIAAREPGREAALRRALVIATTGLALAFIAPLAHWVVGAIANEASGRAAFFSPGWLAADVSCMRASVAFGLAPAAVALVLLLRAAPLRPATTALAFGASACALGAIVVHAACAMEPSARHFALGHALPTIVGALAALPLAPLLSRWRSR